MKRKLLACMVFSCLFGVGSANATELGSETITFDEAISGLPFFNFDSGDPDDVTDLVFTTTDPFGFNTGGPGPDQLYIQEPGLEGITALNPDLHVDFLQGAVGTIEVGFALISDGHATFTAFNQADVAVGT
ncbi:MAG: hypothetical protein GY703_19390 [Gammaproteobacteria bacterium]|nr:hypothetical protein [Gammaproteobacteria bacterium]